MILVPLSAAHCGAGRQVLTGALNLYLWRLRCGRKGRACSGREPGQLPFNGRVPTEERERSSNSTYWFLISILDCNLKAEIQLGFDLRQCLLIDCAAAAKTEFSIRTLNTVKVIVCTSLMYIWNKSSGSSKILAWIWNIWTWIIL